MTAKGYCTKAQVAAFLALTFTAAQETQCDALIEMTEIDVDRYTNRGWLVGAQSNETFYYPDYELFLRYAPVTTLTSITARTGMGATEETLTVDEDYEVRSLENGLIYLVNASAYDRVRVTYTPTASVPAPIKKAMIEWVATQMQSTLRPNTFALDSYSLPDLSVKFARSHVQEAMPPSVREVLDMYRYPVRA
jgi:hypothetical protein